MKTEFGQGPHSHLVTIQNGRAAFADGTDLCLPDWLEVRPSETTAGWWLDVQDLGGFVRRFVRPGHSPEWVRQAVEHVRWDFERIGALP